MQSEKELRELQEIRTLLEEILLRLDKNKVPTVVYPRTRTPYMIRPLRATIVRKVEDYDRR